MEKKQFRTWVKILLISILLTACQVTRESTLDAFVELPLSHATQIDLVINENSGSHCSSYVVEAVYFSKLPLLEFIAEMDASLLLAGWEKVEENLSVDTKIRHIDYRLDDVAYLSIYPEVTPVKSSVPGLLDEYIDMDAWVLPDDYPLDNNNPNDGYFMIEFYYHPYPPNECSG